MEVYETLKEIVGKENVLTEEPLKRHTTFRIGGPAKYFVTPENFGQLGELLLLCKEKKIAYQLIGNGSNLLEPDEGFDGIVICTHKPDVEMSIVKDIRAKQPELHEILFQKEPEADGNVIVTAGAGVMLSVLAARLAERGLAGFAFASGIPGTLGGAVTMNAGAYGGEIKDCILEAQIMQPGGEICTLDKKALQLGYRTSILQKEEWILLSAVFSFEQGVKEDIQGKMRELNEKRREKQPLEYGSAGSTFKRPEGHFAGKLIEDAGLRGYRVGDIMVSEKHCGFVVNVGNGTEKQAKQVIEHVQKTVQDKFGILLEPEVRIL